MAPERWSAKARRFAAAALGIAALGLGFGAGSTAQEGGPGGWELCNQTSFVLEAATGRPEGQSVIVEGWTRIRPGECRLALEGAIKPGVHFVFARSSSAHRKGQRTWNGDVPLCVDPNGSFAVESPSSCTAMGLEQRGFQAVRIDKRGGATLTFRETDNFKDDGQSPANAGIKRLLDDAGVHSVPMIDGYLDRESRAAITNFLAERKLPATLARDVSELTDILEDVARNRSLEVGLLLCNRTDKKIVAAIGRQRAEGWESRGWWTLDAGLCVRAVDETLVMTPHYVYARMEVPQGERYLQGATEPFCTARSKFAIIGRENCEGRRYRTDNFVATAVPEDGKLVYEFFERGFGQPRKPLP